MKKITRFLLGTIALTALWSWGSCYYDNNEELHPELLLNGGQCDTSIVISYQTHIAPVLQGSCGSNNSCHNASGAGGGVVLDNYNGVKASVTTGQFWSAIAWDGNASQMPKNSAAQLNECYMAQIHKWIAAGAPNN